MILSFRLFVNFLPLCSAILQMETTVWHSMVVHQKSLLVLLRIWGTFSWKSQDSKAPRAANYLVMVLKHFDFYLYMMCCWGLSFNNHTPKCI